MFIVSLTRFLVWLTLVSLSLSLIIMVSVHEAKTHLSKLLEKVELGEVVVISRSGKPVAQLVSYTAQKPKRKIGSAAGAFTVPDDFNAPLAEIEDDFYR